MIKNITFKTGIIGVLIIIFLFAAIVAFNKFAGKRIIFLRSDYKEYPLLDQYENVYSSVYGVVKEAEVRSGIGYFTLTNGTKFSLDRTTQNFECSPSQLNSFIRIGDSIAKPKEDFVFYVHRKKICYPFKIKERLRALPIDMRRINK